MDPTVVTGKRCVRIDIGYDGRRFSGSQRQAEVRTVQSELESALVRITGECTRLAFAGRTDRGVHAVGQVASVHVLWEDDLEQLRYGLDSVTSDDVRIYRVTDVDETFHARFSAVRREYRYRIFASDRAPVLLRGLVWPVRTAIDLDRTNLASTFIVGEHDFRSFAGAGLGSSESTAETRRVIDIATWSRLTNDFEPAGQLLEFRVRGNAFLPHMVRNLVGTLIEIGSGRNEVDWMRSLLDLRDRKQAPPPAPPEGLVLWSVEYDDRYAEQTPG